MKKKTFNIVEYTFKWIESVNKNLNYRKGKTLNILKDTFQIKKKRSI